tara:strand:+ start:3493 stop:5778 length:2286 start_codon:yes stop_codon:yes gene_type:complete
MIACYHRFEHEPTPNIDWLVNDAHGDWRHEIFGVGKLATLLYLEDDVYKEVDPGVQTPVTECVNVFNTHRPWSFPVERTTTADGPAVHRRTLGDWGSPPVFWNNGSTCSALSPDIAAVASDAQVPLWAYRNPLRLFDAYDNDGFSVLIWYKLTDSGICLDVDGDGFLDTEAFDGTLLDIENFSDTNGAPDVSDQFHLTLVVDYERDSVTNNDACVNLRATLTNKPANLPAGDTAVAETDYTDGAHIGSITNNDWHCVVLVVNAGRLLMYVDGKLFDGTNADGPSVPEDFHPRCRVNGTVSASSFDGVDKVAVGPVAIYDEQLSEYDAYTLWASMRRPLDIAVEGHWYNSAGGGSGPLTAPDHTSGDIIDHWGTTGPQPSGWKIDGTLDSPHTFTGRRAEYRGDNRWIRMRKAQNCGWGNIDWQTIKFRARTHSQGIINRDANYSASWDGQIHDPVLAGQSVQAVNGNFFFDYHKFHLGFHMESANRNEAGFFMVVGMDHFAHYECGELTTPNFLDHRQGEVTHFDNWVEAGGVSSGGWINSCDGVQSSLDGGTLQPHRGVTIKYHPTDGWTLRYTGHDGTSAGRDVDETLTSNIKMIPNLYNAVVIGTGQSQRVLRQGYNTRSGVLNIHAHEIEDPFGNNNTFLPLDTISSRPQEFDEYLDETEMRNTPGLPLDYGSAAAPELGDVTQLGDLEGTVGSTTDRRAYDFDRIGPLAFCIDELPKGVHERLLRLMQGQHTMRSRPGLRSPLRHVHLNAPTRVTK